MIKQWFVCVTMDGVLLGLIVIVCLVYGIGFECGRVLGLWCCGVGFECSRVLGLCSCGVGFECDNVVDFGFVGVGFEFQRRWFGVELYWNMSQNHKKDAK